MLERPSPPTFFPNTKHNNPSEKNKRENPHLPLGNKTFHVMDKNKGKHKQKSTLKQAKPRVKITSSSCRFFSPDASVPNSYIQRLVIGTH